MSTHQFSVDYEGFTLSGTYEYEPGWKGNEIDPPEPAAVNIEELFIDGKPDNDLLNPRVEHWLCGELLRQHQGI